MTCRCADTRTLSIRRSASLQRKQARGVAVIALAIGVLVGGSSTPTLANEVVHVETRAAVHPSHGRLALDWPSGVEVASTVEDGRLLLGFDRPMTSDLAPARSVLGNFVSAVVPMAGGHGLLMQLRPGVRPEVINVEGSIVVVDLFPEEGSSPPGTVDVRSGHHEDFDRLVLEWPGAIDARVVEREGGTLRIDLSRQDTLSPERLIDRLPSGLEAAAFELVPQGSKLDLHLKPGIMVDIAQFAPNQVAIDLITPRPKLKPTVVWDSVRPTSMSTALPNDAGEPDEIAALLRAQAEAIEMLSREMAALRSGAPDRLAEPNAYRRGPIVALASSELASASGGQQTDLSSTSADRSEAAASKNENAADTATAEEDGIGEDDPELEALNRVLVEAGGLLLPVGGFEIAPTIQYTHSGADGLLVTEMNGTRRVTSQDVKDDQLDLSVTLRAGLPWDSQVDFKLPYTIKSEQVALGGIATEDHNGSGLADIELAFLHQLLREEKYLPDLIGEVRWRAPTGEDSFEVEGDELATGSGFHGVSGTLNATKSYDPLVFFGSLAYTANLASEKNGFDIDPGDEISFAAGAILAAGPGTSLRGGINKSFSTETKIDGQSIAGSDRVSATLQLGAAVALPNRALLDVSAGVGVTEDAPDLSLRASLPYRF